MEPKTIVFFCIPAHGHTNPTLGVVQELVSRGHRVVYYSYEMLRDKIESTGAEFVSCDDYDMEQKLDAKDTSRIGGDLAFSAKILVDTTLALDDQVCHDMERLRPDCIVADSMAVWGKAVAVKLGVPFVSSTTTFAFNQDSAKIMPQEPKDLFKMLLAMPRANRHIRRLRNHGYPVRNVLDVISNDNHTHTIVYTSPEFQPCADTFSKEHYCFVGPSVRPAVEKIEKRREKLIYISMGTVNNAFLPLYKACIEAFADAPYQIILSVGSMVELQAFGILPENIEVYPYVDQIAVLQKADVFLTHCGMNSATEALYYGVPLVMLPKTKEQKGVAARVYQLGAGTYLKKESPLEIRRDIDAVLKEDSFRVCAERIAADFRRCPGAAAAADKIMSVCR